MNNKQQTTEKHHWCAIVKKGALLSHGAGVETT
jgi:hypothetical protein